MSVDARTNSNKFSRSREEPRIIRARGTSGFIPEPARPAILE